MSSAEAPKLTIGEWAEAFAKKGLMTRVSAINILHKEYPKRKLSDWFNFFRWLLAGTGSAFFLSGIIFFFAFNWDKIGKFGKLFGLQAACLVAAVIALSNQGAMLRKISLTVAAVLVGAFLAVFGQIYQTGADPYQLFLGWSILILPWVIAGQFPPLWLLFIVLLNTTMVTFFRVQPFRNDEEWYLLGVTGLNLLVLAAWEYIGTLWKWARVSWLPRLLVLAVALALVFDFIFGLFGRPKILGSGIFVLIGMGGIGGGILFYITLRKDLFAIAIGFFAVMAMVVGLELKGIDRPDAGTLLFIALTIVAMMTGAVACLRYLHKEWSK